jgi:hypothetical protein
MYRNGILRENKFCFHGTLAIQSSSLNDDVDDMSSSESLCPGGGGAPSGAGASGFLKRAHQQNITTCLNIP